MADIAWTDVLDMAPQLTAVPTGAQTAILNHVNQELEGGNYAGGDASPSFFLARVLLASHFGEIQRRRGQLGIVTSKRIGVEAVDINYMARLVLEPLQATPYGEQYLLMVQGSAARFGVPS